MEDTDCPVMLTSAAPDNAFKGHLLIFDVVPPAVVSRSGVLSSILESIGTSDASIKLPDFITLPEFKIWSSTITTEENASRCQDIARACSVVKAADALDDPCLDEWLKATVRLMREADSAHQFSGSCRLLDATSAALSRLPDHLLQRVLQEAFAAHKEYYLSLPRGVRPEISFPSGPQTENCAIAAWLEVLQLPSHHHRSLIERMISPQLTLAAPAVVRSLPFLNALSQLQASPPALLGLDLGEEVTYAYRFDSLPQSRLTSEGPGAASAALAAALRHHSSLTSLRINTFCDNDSMQTLAPAIATLTALKMLYLGADHSVVLSTEALPCLKEALSSLCSLQAVRLCVGVDPWCGHYFDNRSSTEAAAATSAHAPVPQPRHCLAGMFPAATALTSLDLSLHQQCQPFTTCRPLVLPCLQHLTLSHMDHGVVCSFLSHLAAPLSTVVLRGRGWALADLPAAPQLWTNLAKFVQLCSLDINLRLSHEATQMEDALLAGASAAIAGLPCLEELRVSSDFHVLHRLAEQLAVGVRGARLRCLMLKSETLSRHGPYAAVSWRDLMPKLSTLPLQCLHIDIERGWGAREFPGLAALRPLTQLTALLLYGWVSCLDTAADVEALARMQQLRSLCTDSLVVPPELQEACVRTLGTLPALTDLELQLQSRGDGLHAAFAEHAAWAAWPALQRLSLFPVSAAQAVALARTAVAACPALQQLTLSDEHSGQFVGPETDVRRQILEVTSAAGIEVDVGAGHAPREWKSRYAIDQQQRWNQANSDSG